MKKKNEQNAHLQSQQTYNNTICSGSRPKNYFWSIEAKKNIFETWNFQNFGIIEIFRWKNWKWKLHRT